MKSEAGERALPAFDLARKVGTKLALQRFRRSVVLCVVDIADFDGSLPREALNLLLQVRALWLGILLPLHSWRALMAEILRQNHAFCRELAHDRYPLMPMVAHT